MIFDRRRAARPYLLRAVLGVAVAVAGSVICPGLYHFHPKHWSVDDLIALIGVALILIGGVIAVRSFSRAVYAAAGDRLEGRTKGTPISFLINGFGYILLALLVLHALGAQLQDLLLGGALTGVALGIAAQQTLGNLFAGMVLLLVRPFSVGELIYLKGTLGEYEGTVTEMSLFYVHVSTDRGPVMLPNAGVLASAVGPGARAEKQKEREEADEAAETKEL